MNVLIAGASGFIGQKLVTTLQVNHSITVLGRDMANLQCFREPINKITWSRLPETEATEFDAVINLCGYNIAAGRWNKAIKKQLIDSRVKTTTILIGRLNRKLNLILFVQTLSVFMVCRKIQTVKN